MRWLFFVFLIISLVLHLFLLGVLHMDQGKPTKQKPIEVRLVPPKKQDEKLPMSPKPTPQPQKPTPQRNVPDEDYYKKMPLKDNMDTSVRQDKPVLKGAERKVKAGSPDSKQKPTGKPVVTGPKNSSPAPQPIQGQQKSVEVPRVQSGSTQGHYVPQDNVGLDKKRIDDIMHPKDIIDKYANNEAGASGEDAVSMEYVKMRYQSYFAKFARRLYQVWTYPEAAGMRGEQGVVQASFIISRDGSISSIRILRSSGSPDLDNEVLIALKKMYGVPLPESYQLNSLNVNAYFRYIIGGGFQVY